MRIRHRIPSIFNLSMVDVLCCALGCVILIWLINLRDSKQHQEETALLLDRQKGEIADLEKMRDDLKRQTADQADIVQRLEAKLQVATANEDFLRASLKAGGKELDAAAGRRATTCRTSSARPSARSTPCRTPRRRRARPARQPEENPGAGRRRRGPAPGDGKGPAQRRTDLDETGRKLLDAKKEAAQRPRPRRRRQNACGPPGGENQGGCESGRP